MKTAARNFAFGLLVALSGLGSVSAANIVIQNNDGTGEGFNATTPVSPVGGNSGTTLGQQRLNVFANAAAIWGAILDSNVTIVVQSNFDPLTCTSSQAVLGSAGPTTVHRNFFNAPYSNTYYAVAPANSLSNSDQNSSSPEIAAQFNSSVDNNNNCLNNTNWYYGIDGNAPAGTIDLRTVVLHELGHGLGFLTFVNTATGEKFNTRNDAFMLNLEDHSLGLSWSSMTNSQRVASAIDTGDLHWTGSQVTANRGGLTGGVSGGHVRMYAPNTLASGSSVSHFDTALSPNELMEPIINGPKNDPGLAVSLMKDIGWNLLTPVNTPPTISSITNKSINEDTVSSLITFTVSDQQTAAGSLIVTASSSNTGIVKNSGLALGGSGANRNLTITPVSNANGAVTITVSVSDGSLGANSAFQLTVIAVNDPPIVTVTNPVDAAVYGESANITFSATANDIEDGNIAANVQWNSDIDGALGGGANLVRNLSLGNHIVTASITDSGSTTVTDQVSLTVNPDWDMDGDGMADDWEMANFGTLARDGTGDFDNDGILDLQEYLNALHNGDVNGDGQINAGDLILAQRHLMGISLLSQSQIDRGDLYPQGAADGILDMSDLILLQKMLLNQ